MTLLRRAASLFLQASGLITVYAALLCGATAVLLPTDWQVPIAVYGLVGGGTLAAYNYHALVHQAASLGRTEVQAASAAWLIPFQRMCVTIGAAVVGLSLMQLPPIVWTLSAAMAVLTMLYSVPMFAFGKKRRLKDFGGLKWIVLVAVWTFSTTLIPATGAGLSLPDAWLMLRDEMIVRALLLAPLCFAFDMRDVKVDTAAGVRTLPAWLGMNRSYRLMAVLFGCFALANAFLFRDFTPFAALGFAVALFGWLAARAAVRSGGNAVAYLFWLDGTLALYATSRIIVAWTAA